MSSQNYSLHASHRLRERGIDPSDVLLVLRFGSQREGRNGAHLWKLSARDARRVGRELRLSEGEVIRRFRRGLVVVVSECDKILTVYLDQEANAYIKLCTRGAKRRRAAWEQPQRVVGRLNAQFADSGLPQAEPESEATTSKSIGLSNRGSALH